MPVNQMRASQILLGHLEASRCSQRYDRTQSAFGLDRPQPGREILVDPSRSQEPQGSCRDVRHRIDATSAVRP